MFYLLGAVLCSVLIGNMLVIFTKNKSSDLRFIFLGNYIVAALFSLALSLPQGLSISSIDIWFGVLTGLFFLSNFVVYQKNIVINGLSFSVGIMRVSVIIPTLIAVLIFSESMGFINVVGIFVILSAFILMIDAKPMRNLFWLVFLFLISGLTESTLKIYNELGSANQNSFLFIVFASAGLFTLMWILFTNRTFHLQSLYHGFALGLPNQLSSLLFLYGLNSIKATIAYPFYASSVVILTIACDVFVWKKLFTTRQRLILAFLCLGVLFVSLSSANR